MYVLTLKACRGLQPINCRVLWSMGRVYRWLAALPPAPFCPNSPSSSSTKIYKSFFSSTIVWPCSRKIVQKQIISRRLNCQTSKQPHHKTKSAENMNQKPPKKKSPSEWGYKSPSGWWGFGPKWEPSSLLWDPQCRKIQQFKNQIEQNNQNPTTINRYHHTRTTETNSNKTHIHTHETLD